MNKATLTAIFCAFFSHSSLAMLDIDENIYRRTNNTNDIKNVKNNSFDKESIEKSEIYLKLGVHYHKSGNFSEALEYFKKSAVFENPSAEYNIGLIYEFIDSNKINRNLDESLKWYNKANIHGHKEAKKSYKTCF